MDILRTNNTELNDIRGELDKRFEKIVEYGNIILDLKIEIKRKEIENLVLTKEINELNNKLTPRHNKTFCE